MPEYAGGPSYGYRARRRRLGPLRVVGVALAVILALVIALQLVGRFGLGPSAPGVLAATSAPPSAPPASATPTAYPPPSAGAPSATPRPKPERKRPNRSLTRNSLYAVDLDGTRVACGIKVRAVKPPLRNADLAPYLRSVVKCLVKVHRKPLAARGFTVRETSTPIGEANSPRSTGTA